MVWGSIKIAPIPDIYSSGNGSFQNFEGLFIRLTEAGLGEAYQNGDISQCTMLLIRRDSYDLVLGHFE